MHDSSNTVGMFGVFFWRGEGDFNAIFSLYKHQEQTNRNKETMKEPPLGGGGRSPERRRSFVCSHQKLELAKATFRGDGKQMPDTCGSL